MTNEDTEAEDGGNHTKAGAGVRHTGVGRNWARNPLFFKVILSAALNMCPSTPFWGCRTERVGKTFCAGQVGRWHTKECLQQGWEYRGVVRTPSLRPACQAGQPRPALPLALALAPPREGKRHLLGCGRGAVGVGCSGHPAWASSDPAPPPRSTRTWGSCATTACSPPPPQCPPTP